MKRNYIALAALLLSSLTFSCKKNALQVIDTPVDASAIAQIKYFNFGVNAPAVNFYANGGKVSAISSAPASKVLQVLHRAAFIQYQIIA